MLGSELVLVHEVESNEGACPSESSPAVDSYSFPSADDLVAQLQELNNNVVGRVASIGVLHVVHLDIVSFELTMAVHLLVESYDCLDFVAQEHVHEEAWFECPILGIAGGTAHGQDLSRDNPVDVALVELVQFEVLSSVEGLVSVPALLNR